MITDAHILLFLSKKAQRDFLKKEVYAGDASMELTCLSPSDTTGLQEWRFRGKVVLVDSVKYLLESDKLIVNSVTHADNGNVCHMFSTVCQLYFLLILEEK